MLFTGDAISTQEGKELVSCHARWAEAAPTIFWALPNAYALMSNSRKFWEFLGYSAYRLRGWI